MQEEGKHVWQPYTRADLANELRLGLFFSFGTEASHDDILSCVLIL